MGGRPATRPIVDEAFNEFWKAYPKRDGANPKQPASKKFAGALKSGADAESLIAGARRYALECRDRKIVGTPMVAQAQTWLNQQRWTDYAPAPAQIRAPPPEPTAEELREREQLIAEGKALLNAERNGRILESTGENGQSNCEVMAAIRNGIRTFQ